MRRKFLSLTIVTVVAVVAAIIFSFTAAAQAQTYRLEKVLIFSRHNLRVPTIEKNSLLVEVTPHEWFKWTAAPQELTLRGGILETEMGQYFRAWLVSENFMPENYLPAEGEVRFYANSKQRTIATARYFASGMLPVANVEIEHKFDDYEQTDPVFAPKLTFVSDSFFPACSSHSTFRNIPCPTRSREERPSAQKSSSRSASARTASTMPR